MAADLLFTTLAAGDVAVATVIQRRDGKGRRPKASQVNSAIKRQSLQIETLMKVMPGLGDLASVRNGKPVDTARAIAAARATEGDR